MNVTLYGKLPYDPLTTPSFMIYQEVAVEQITMPDDSTDGDIELRLLSYKRRFLDRYYNEMPTYHKNKMYMCIYHMKRGGEPIFRYEVSDA